jgi:very-short-patch-repair endonuclease|tara:strand:+ start:5130 stop:5465 length:336 start_codon:yes stop_codon:yes gene_type:complete
MATQVVTDIEAIVIEWLEQRKISYQFQTSLGGGIFELGGAVVDIILPDLRIAIRIHGEYWHQGIAQRGQDIAQRELLEGMGWVVVDIWGSDVENKLNETMTKALRGEEMLR